MNEEKDPRAHDFACWVGIDYPIALLVCKRIPKKVVIRKHGKEWTKDGDGKVFAILMAIAQKKRMGNLLMLSPTEEIEYLTSHGAEETLDYLSYTVIHYLYQVYKIKEIIGNVLPKEINPKELEPQEVESLIRWLFP